MSGFWPWRAGAAIAGGHMASMAVVAAAVAFGLPLDRPALQWGAGALLVVALACHWRNSGAWAAQVGMALCAFITATAHGAGFVLMPALMSICGSGASGPLLQTLAAMGLHLAAMLVANGAIVCVACCLRKPFARWLACLRVSAG